jgi:RNA polymerase sigma-70 factor (ECF subfamily)
VLKDENPTKHERPPNSVVEGDNACDHQKTTGLSGQSIERTTLQPPERDIMLAAVPNLRAFAMSLSGNADRADDLVQGTLLRAIANIDSFASGTNMQAWLFTILRNLFRSEFRKRRREVEDADGSYVDSLTSAPQQYGRLEFRELFAALAKLPLDQREALLLVGASGFSYDEAAAICEIPVGTIKSRANRARMLLAELLCIDGRTYSVQPHDRRGRQHPTVLAEMPDEFFLHLNESRKVGFDKIAD